MRLFDRRAGRREERFGTQPTGDRPAERQRSRLRKTRLPHSGIHAFTRKIPLFGRLDAAHPVPVAQARRPLRTYFGADDTLQRLPAQRPVPRAPRRTGIQQEPRPQPRCPGRGTHLEKRPAPLPGHARHGLPERSHARRRCLYRNPHRYPASDFSDPAAGGFFFWTGFAPKWIDLLELYETTAKSAISKRRTAVHGSIPNIFGIARKFPMRTSP